MAYVRDKYPNASQLATEGCTCVYDQKEYNDSWARAHRYVHDAVTDLNTGVVSVHPAVDTRCLAPESEGSALKAREASALPSRTKNLSLSLPFYLSIIHPSIALWPRHAHIGVPHCMTRTARPQVGWIDWNMLLDISGPGGTGGPNHANNTCFAHVHVSEDNSLVIHDSYWAFGHLSRFIPRGSWFDAPSPRAHARHTLRGFPWPEVIQPVRMTAPCAWFSPRRVVKHSLIKGAVDGVEGLVVVLPDSGLAAVLTNNDRSENATSKTVRLRDAGCATIRARIR